MLSHGGLERQCSTAPKPLDIRCFRETGPLDGQPCTTYQYFSHLRGQPLDTATLPATNMELDNLLFVFGIIVEDFMVFSRLFRGQRQPRTMSPARPFQLRFRGPYPSLPCAHPPRSRAGPTAEANAQPQAPRPPGNRAKATKDFGDNHG